MRVLNPLFTRDAKDSPPALTAEQRRHGRRLLYRFYTLNGISVACLMNNILVLYAIRNGLSDSMVAVMASFIHLAMPFILLGKPAIARLGAARTRGLGWFFRYISASIIILAPAAGRFSSQTAVTVLILTGTFGFAAFRSIGVAAVSPLYGEAAEKRKRGNLVSNTIMRVQITYLITMALIILGFRYVDELWLYQIIIGVGCVVGLYASTIIANVPESRAPRQSAQKTLLEMLRSSFGTDSSRMLVSAWCAGLASKAIVIPFMMIALKNGYGVSDYSALIFALILVMGAVSSGLVNRKIADSVGARSLLLMNIIVLMGVTAFWSVAPIRFMPPAIAATFLLAGFSDIGISTGLHQHLLEVVPGRDRVGNSLLINIVSGAAAGLAGAVVGGGLLKLLQSTGLVPFDVYRRYFLIISAILLFFFMVFRRIKMPAFEQKL